MKRSLLLIVAIAVCAAAAFAQPADAKTAAAVKAFPGFTAFQMKTLLEAKKVTPVALPTWLPAGFKVEKVNMTLGKSVPIQDRVLEIIYVKPLAGGKRHRFAIEAGFDGLGGLPYDVTKTIRSAVGPIDLMYEPPDLEDGTKIRNYSYTEWFDVSGTAYHYNGMASTEEGDSSLVMISLADTQKILASIKRL